MTFWEQSNGLGRLEILEVYEYYDRPVLLALRSASEAIYIAVLVETDNKADQWLCVAVSQLRFEAVRSGGVDLRTGFGRPEDDQAFLFNVPHRDVAPIVFSSIRAVDIANEWLPAPNVKLDLPTTTLPVLARDIKTEAVQSHRDQIGINLDVVGTTRNEAPARLAGRVLEAIQNIIETLVPSGGSELMFMRVVGGSFEMHLASADQNLNESAITRASEEFGRLVQLADDDAAFRQHAATLKQDVADSYLEFLRAIEDGVTVATIEWASPKPDNKRGRAVIRNERVKSSIDVMVELHQTREFTVEGTLLTTHVTKNTFEFESDKPYNGMKEFSGKASEDVLDPVKRNTPGLRFRATIKEVRQRKGAAPKYTLVRLEELV